MLYLESSFCCFFFLNKTFKTKAVANLYVCVGRRLGRKGGGVGVAAPFFTEKNSHAYHTVQTDTQCHRWKEKSIATGCFVN